jgi:hypothetical protein
MGSTRESYASLGPSKSYPYQGPRRPSCGLSEAQLPDYLQRPGIRALKRSQKRAEGRVAPVVAAVRAVARGCLCR